MKSEIFNKPWNYRNVISRDFVLGSGEYRNKIPIMLYTEILFINWNEGERLSASIKWLNVCGCLRMDRLIDMKQAPKAQECVMGEIRYYMAVFDVVIKLFWRKTEKRIGHRQHRKLFTNIESGECVRKVLRYWLDILLLGR